MGGDVTVLSEPNCGHMPIRDYSLGLGEVLSKTSRNELCLLCLREIKKNLDGEGKLPAPKGRRRGRPQSAATILAARVGVVYDSVQRWRDPAAIQACDRNGEILARIAYEYDPDGAIAILRQDAASHRAVIEDWISQRAPLIEPDIPDIVAEVEEGA